MTDFSSPLPFAPDIPDSLMADIMMDIRQNGRFPKLFATFPEDVSGVFTTAFLIGKKVSWKKWIADESLSYPDLRVIEKQKAELVKSIEEAPEDWKRYITLWSKGAVSAICAPLRYDGTVYGALTTFRTANQKPFSSHDLIEFQKILSEKSTSIFLVEKLRPWTKKIAHFLLTFQVSSLISSSFDPEIILESALHTAALITGAEASSLLLLGDNKHDLLFKYATGPKSEEIKKFKLELGKGIAGNVALTGEPMIVPDVNREPLFDPHISTAIGFPTRSILCVPLRVKNKILGAIEVINKDNPDEVFDLVDMESLIAIAGQAAVAIENSRLFLQAMTDPLTGLYSRRYFQEAFKRDLHRASRNKKPLSILVLDVDNFKKFNDSYGHQLGDKVLKSVAETIMGCMRASDVAARYGGEEFVVLLNDVGKEGAMVAAERIRENVEKKFVQSKDGPLSVTCSIGMAVYPDDSAESERLFFLADNALYDAKQAGKNRVMSASK